MSISSENKIIAKSALQVFGGKPQVSKHWDESNVSNIDMLSSADRPYEGITSYSTIGPPAIQLNILLMELLYE